MVHVTFKALPARMPGASGDTPEMISLGRDLYYEKQLSLNGSQSCNDCHRLDRNYPGADNTAVSDGAKGGPGTRNSPTVINAGFQSLQFWDGRATDLVEQAKGPILNPVEMAMPDETAAVKRLQGVPRYRSAFGAAFPDDEAPISYNNVARAIAAFERTLVVRSRFDRFIEGDKASLSASEKAGAEVFMNTGCMECHSGIGVGGRFTRKMGYFHPYADQADMGRFPVTKNPADKYYFKVPILRNVTLTPPYFHDGGVATIHDAVRQMAWMQLDVKLSPSETESIVEFLTTLAGEHLVQMPPS